jgi:hypothetical protein
MNLRRRISAPKLRGPHSIGSNEHFDRAQIWHQNHCRSAQPMSLMGKSRRTQAPQCFAQCPLCLRYRPMVLAAVRRLVPKGDIALSNFDHLRGPVELATRVLLRFQRCRPCAGRCSCGFLGNFHNSRQPNGEGRATAGLALDGNVTAHHLTEAPADREAKARAAIFACRGGGSLGKLLEQLAHLLRRHADAGVGYRECDPVAAVLLCLVSGDGDRSLLRELIGVTCQVLAANVLR